MSFIQFVLQLFFVSMAIVAFIFLFGLFSIDWAQNNLLGYYAGSSVLGSASGLVWEAYGWLGLTLAITCILIIGLGLAIKLKKK